MANYHFISTEYGVHSLHFTKLRARNAGHGANAFPTAGYGGDRNMPALSNQIP